MATKVNQKTIKKLSLKKLAKQKKKHIGTGDGGLLSKKIYTLNK